MIVRDAARRLSRRPGKGPWDTDVEPLGLTWDTDQLNVTWRDCSAEVAGHLGLEAGGRVLVRSRRHLVNGSPRALSASYLPAGLAAVAGLDRTDTGPGGLHARLADIGLAPVDHEETVTTRRSTYDEQTRLGLGVQVTVYAITRVSRSAGGRCVEVVAEIRPTAHFQLRYRFTTPESP